MARRFPCIVWCTSRSIATRGTARICRKRCANRTCFQRSSASGLYSQTTGAPVGICAPPARRARPPRRQRRGRARRMGLAGTNAHGLIRRGWGLTLPGRPRCFISRPTSSHGFRRPEASAGARSPQLSAPTAKHHGYLLLTCVNARAADRHSHLPPRIRYQNLVTRLAPRLTISRSIANEVVHD